MCYELMFKISSRVHNTDTQMLVEECACLAIVQTVLIDRYLSTATTDTTCPGELHSVESPLKQVYLELEIPRYEIGSSFLARPQPLLESIDVLDTMWR
jgi:hypothetical protein